MAITKRSAARTPKPAFKDVTPDAPKLSTGVPVNALIANNREPAVYKTRLSFLDSQYETPLLTCGEKSQSGSNSHINFPVAAFSAINFKFGVVAYKTPLIIMGLH